MQSNRSVRMLTWQCMLWLYLKHWGRYKWPILLTHIYVTRPQWINSVVSVVINGKDVVEVEKWFIWLGAMHRLRVHIYLKKTKQKTTHTHIRKCNTKFPIVYLRPRLYKGQLWGWQPLRPPSLVKMCNEIKWKYFTQNKTWRNNARLFPTWHKI